VRRAYFVVIAVAIVVFLAVSAVLARVWSADGAESSALTAVVQAEAHGDESGVLGRIQGCRTNASCQARVAGDIAALRHPGSVAILQTQPSTGFSLTGTTGTARIAWRVGSSLPIVQCVRVRRAGDALSGLRIELLAISRRIKSDGDCPATF
jgi:hypothetical protein